MSNRVDLIKGMIIRYEKNKYTRRGDKKQANKICCQLKANFNALFKEEDDEVFEHDFYRLISSTAANSYIANNFFPCDMGEYGRYRNIIDFTDDLHSEMRWLIYCIKFYSNQLTDFVRAREEYDNYILINEYEKALDVIKNVEKKFGPSLWGMEGKFFIYSKLEIDNSELMNEVPENIIGTIINFYELKNRENVTSAEYFYIANKEIKTAKRNYLSEAEKYLEFYAYEITSLVYELSEEKILQILYVIRQVGLIDRYIFFIDVCDYIVTAPKGTIKGDFQQYITFLGEIEDDHLTAIRFILDNNENRKSNYVQKTRLDHAKAEFIKGNVKEAREEAINLLVEFPNNIGAINLYVEANILVGDSEEIYQNTNLGILLKNLELAYTLNKKRDDCIAVINQLANACSQSTWSKAVLSSTVFRCQEYKNREYERANILANIQHLDIETIVASMEREESLSFIEKNMGEDNHYIKFKSSILKRDYDVASTLCGINQIKDLLMVYSDNQPIYKKMKHLRKIEGKDASIAIMAMKYFLSTIDLSENLDIAMKLSTMLIIDNIFTSLFIPLKKIVDQIDQGRENIGMNICTPILYYVYATYFNREKMDDLGIICEDFFLFRGIEKPTKMELFSEEYEKKELVYFLKNICSTKIMDISISAFLNSQERDKERVEICNILTQLDPDNAKEYEKEIREVTQKLMINAELKIIEENRIHVNVDGMRDRLEQAYKNDFLRYKFYKDERMKHLNMILEGETSDKLQIRDTPERILQELVLHIRDSFVSSDEYGLNGYLSLNIRHGTLEDELRSPLYKSYLNAKKDINSGRYVINNHWTTYANKCDLEVMEKAITDFHIKTEAIIAKLKGKYIQIRTEDKVTEGIFDYRLYEEALFVIQIKEIVTFEEFLDTVINYLWEITERNLNAIKQIIKDEIAKDYTNAFKELRSAALEVSNRDQLRDLQQKITEASTDMPNTLDKICYWFQRSTESQHNDFDLQFAFNLGLQTISNMHPEKRFTTKILEQVESEKISGRYLKNFDGIFYNLFDNIYKKAMSLDGRDIEIRYKLRYVKNKFHIYIENDYDCSTDISEDEDKVKQAKKLINSGEYLQKVKGEGGTGIPKIVKIIVYDLRRIFKIDFGYKKEKNIFYMEIEF